MLTNVAISKVKPGPKAFKLTDEKGLYLLVQPNGSRWWRFDYRRPDGRRNTLSLGTLPDVNLKSARERRDEARRLLANGVDPGIKRSAEKQAVEDSFEAIGREWFAKFSPVFAPSNSAKIIRQLEKDLFPWLGGQPIKQITPPALLACIRRIEHRGAIESAHRALQLCSRIFRYGVACGRCERDPSADLRGAIPPAQGKNHAAIITPVEAGELLRAIDEYRGSFVVRCVLKFAALTATRSGEFRGAEWSEFELESGIWTIPASRMKGRIEHKVMLSRQALALLEELHPLTGKSALVFPGERGGSSTLSNNSTNAALRRMGFTKEEMTTHGFRAMFSSMANENGWDADVIERSLAHIESNSSRRPYHRAEYVDERKKLAQWWADHLDDLRNGSAVTYSSSGLATGALVPG